MPRDKKQYSKTREDFDRMSMEDRASFLIEATFSTAAEALDRAGRQLVDLAEEMRAQSKKKRKQKGTNDTSESSSEHRSEGASDE